MNRLSRNVGVFNIGSLKIPDTLTVVFGQIESITRVCTRVGVDAVEAVMGDDD
jgi:hypothetical protein